MTIHDILRGDEAAILAEAATAVRWLAHYRQDGGRAAERLGALLRLVQEAVQSRDLEGLLVHARRVAADRRAAGYGVAEVERAFDALEEAIWHRARAGLSPAEQVWGLSLVGTAMAHARIALRTAFAALEPDAMGPALDLSRIFRNAEAARGAPAPEELVHPV
jgi:hypothetical protein